MPVTIALRNDLPFFDVQANLETITYTLEFRWNVRADQGKGAWFLSVFDQQGVTPYMYGLKMVANYPLGLYITGRKPPGLFMAVDTSGQQRDPGLNDLGARVKLIYFSAAELGL